MIDEKCKECCNKKQHKIGCPNFGAAKQPDADEVERVARALSRWRNDKKLAYPDFDALTPEIKLAYMEQAKAAIAAMNNKEG